MTDAVQTMTVEEIKGKLRKVVGELDIYIGLFEGQMSVLPPTSAEDLMKGGMSEVPGMLRGNAAQALSACQQTKHLLIEEFPFLSEP